VDTRMRAGKIPKRILDYGGARTVSCDVPSISESYALALVLPRWDSSCGLASRIAT